MAVARAQQGDTLDLLCWRELGATDGVVPRVLELNRGLADAGPILAEGREIVLPDDVATATATVDLVQLWD